jgi:hypothetical protein
MLGRDATSQFVCVLRYMLRAIHVAWYKTEAHDKGKPAARRRRKAAGLLREAAGLPEGELVWTSPQVSPSPTRET